MNDSAAAVTVAAAAVSVTAAVAVAAVTVTALTRRISLNCDWSTFSPSIAERDSDPGSEDLGPRFPAMDPGLTA